VLDLPADGWPEYFSSQNVRVSPERDGIRVSFGLFNTTDDIDRLAEIIRARNAPPARVGAA
jgi:cysteine desulfurase/selenocysteine lyase